MEAYLPVPDGAVVLESLQQPAGEGAHIQACSLHCWHLDLRQPEDVVSKIVRDLTEVPGMMVELFS